MAVTVYGNYLSSTRYRVGASGLTYGTKYCLFVEDLNADNTGNGYWYCRYANTLYDTVIDYREASVSYTGRREIRLYSGTSAYTVGSRYSTASLPSSGFYRNYIEAYGGQTTYTLNMTACNGIYRYYYYINGTEPRLSCLGSRDNPISFGTTRGYILLDEFELSDGYSHPIKATATSGTPSWDVTLDDGSFDDEFIWALSSGGIRTVTLSATLGATYYGRLRLDANEGAFPGTGYTSISWPTTGVVSGTGTSGALVSITLPVAGGNYVPARDGYKFDGWVSENGSTFYSSGDPVSFTAKSTSSSNPTTLTLYAVWEKLPDIAPFYWDGANGTNDATLIAKGQPVSNITADRWNNLLSKIKELADACGADFRYTRVSSGDGITATQFNVARNGLNSIRTKLGATSTAIPAEQSKGGTIYATLFVGNGSLKGALNALIGVYNG